MKGTTLIILAVIGYLIYSHVKKMQVNKTAGGGGGSFATVYGSTPSGTVTKPTQGIRSGNSPVFKDPGSYVPSPNVRRQ